MKLSFFIFMTIILVSLLSMTIPFTLTESSKGILRGVYGNGDDEGVMVLPVDMFHQLKPVNIGHDDIEQRDIVLRVR